MDHDRSGKPSTPESLFLRALIETVEKAGREAGRRTRHVAP